MRIQGRCLHCAPLRTYGVVGTQENGRAVIDLNLRIHGVRLKIATNYSPPILAKESRTNTPLLVLTLPAPPQCVGAVLGVFRSRK